MFKQTQLCAVVPARTKAEAAMKPAAPYGPRGRMTSAGSTGNSAEQPVTSKMEEMLRAAQQQRMLHLERLRMVMGPDDMKEILNTWHKDELEFPSSLHAPETEASAQTTEESSSCQSLNAEQPVLPNLLTDSAAEPALHAILGESGSIAHTHSAAQPVETIALRVVSAWSREHMFGPLQVCPTDTVS